MLKKLKIITILIIIISIVFVHFSYAISNTKIIKNDFMTLSSEKLCIGDTLDIELKLSQIEEDNFEVEISSNISLKDTYVDQNTKIKLNNEKNDTDKIIVMDIDKSKLDLDKITLHFVISNDLNVGDKIKLSAKVTLINSDEKDDATFLEENKSIEIMEDTNIEEKANEDEEKVEKETQKTETKKEQEIDDKQTNSNQNTNKKESNENADTKTVKEESNNNISSQSKSTQAKTSTTTNTQTVTYKGSNNNYLTNIEVEGYSLNTNFNKDNTNYFITVNSKDVLNINTTQEDSTAKVQIIGNDSISNGINKILISVTAQNGNIRYYRIFVTCEEE